MMTGKVTGLDGLEKALLELSKTYANPKYAMQAVRPALKKAVKPIEDDIRQGTPTDRGNLKDSTKTRIMATNKQKQSIFGYPTVMHAEVGWQWRKGDGVSFKQAVAIEEGTSESPPQKVVQGSLERHKNGTQQLFKRELAKSIDKKALQLKRKFDKNKKK